MRETAILAIGLAFIAVLGLALAYAVLYDYRSVRQEGRALAESLSLAVNSFVERTLKQVDTLVVDMAHHFGRLPVGAFDGPGELWLRKVKADTPYLMDLVILDAAGRVTHWTGDGPKPQAVDVAYYRRHIDAPDLGLVVDVPRVSQVYPGRWFFSLSRRMIDDQGRFTGVAVAIVDVRILTSYVKQLLRSFSATAFLIHHDGTPMLDVSGHAVEVAANDIGPSPGFKPIVDDRRPRGQIGSLFFEKSNAPNELQVMVAVDHQAAYDGWKLRSLGLLGAWALISATILWLVMRQHRFECRQAELIAELGQSKSDLEQANRTLETLAATDPLTGINNRRNFFRVAGVEVARARRYRADLAIIMIDVDHFKHINDSFGHEVGDRVLAGLAAVTAAGLRPTDCLARYGGEEFAILAPNTDLDGAISLAERIRADIAAFEPPGITPPPRVTASFGVALWQVGETDLAPALSRADAALYQAKHAGRDTVCGR